MPFESDLNTASMLLKYIPPASGTPNGDPMDTLNAGTGVGCGAPPAILEITYSEPGPD
jgi:hypothetical protein